MMIDYPVDKTHFHLIATLPNMKHKATYGSFVHRCGRLKDRLIDWGSLLCFYVLDSRTPKILAIVLYPQTNIYTK